MNIWENAVITSKGLALQSKLTQGTSLTITSVVAAKGYNTPALLQQQTNVLEPVQELEFVSESYPEEGKCSITARLTNEKIDTGYTARQVGVYAMDPDEGKILYFICQSSASTEGTNVPSNTEMPGYSAEWTFYFQYGQADGVSVNVDPSHTINAQQAQQMVDAGLVSAKAYTDQKIAAIPTPDVSGQIETHNTSSTAHSDIRNEINNVKTVAEGAAKSNLSNVSNEDFAAKIALAGGNTLVNVTSSDGLNYSATIPGFIEIDGKRITFSPNKDSTGIVSLNVNGGGPVPVCRMNSDGTFASSSIGRSANLKSGCLYTATRSSVFYSEGNSWKFETAWVLDYEKKPCASDMDGIAYGTADLEAGVTPLETGKLYFVYE